MEERIEVQKGKKGEIIFNKLDELGRDHKPEYDSENEERFNTSSMEMALEDVLVNFAALNDLINQTSDDNAGIVTIFDAIYRDVYQQVGGVLDFVKTTLGEVEFKFWKSPFTCGAKREPAALIFKPGELLLKSLKPAAEAKNQKVKGPRGKGPGLKNVDR